MNELKAPECGYRLLKCGYDGCQYQLVDAVEISRSEISSRDDFASQSRKDDSEMYQHLVAEHADQLARSWQLGRVEG